METLIYLYIFTYINAYNSKVLIKGVKYVYRILCAANIGEALQITLMAEIKKEEKKREGSIFRARALVGIKGTWTLL